MDSRANDALLQQNFCTGSRASTSDCTAAFRIKIDDTQVDLFDDATADPLGAAVLLGQQNLNLQRNRRPAGSSSLCGNDG